MMGEITTTNDALAVDCCTGHPRRHEQRNGHRITMLAGVLMLATVGCVDDNSDQLSTDDRCGAAAALIPALIDNDDRPGSDAVETAVDDLVMEFEIANDDFADSAALSSLQDLASIDVDAPGREADQAAWGAALVDLDVAVGERCGFDITTVIAELTAAPTESAQNDAAGELSWEQLVEALPNAAWTKLDITGLVAFDPGILVTVSGIEDAETAMTACSDLLAVIEARNPGEQVSVAVQDGLQHLLVASVRSQCDEVTDLSSEGG